jgi:hypothetical protein
VWDRTEDEVGVELPASQNTQVEYLWECTAKFHPAEYPGGITSCPSVTSIAGGNEELSSRNRIKIRRSTSEHIGSISLRTTFQSVIVFLPFHAEMLARDGSGDSVG